MNPDENHGQGGSYVIQDGKRVLVERTQDAPDGNGPRPAVEQPAADTPAPAQSVNTVTAEGNDPIQGDK